MKSLLEKKERLEGPEKIEIMNRLDSLKYKIKSTEEKENSLSMLKKRLNDELSNANNQKELFVQQNKFQKSSQLHVTTNFVIY